MADALPAVNSARQLKWTFRRDGRLMSAALAFSIALHLAPLILFRIELPNVSREKPARIRLGVGLAGARLNEGGVQPSDLRGPVGPGVLPPPSPSPASPEGNHVPESRVASLFVPPMDLPNRAISRPATPESLSSRLSAWRPRSSDTAPVEGARFYPELDVGLPREAPAGVPSPGAMPDLPATVNGPETAETPEIVGGDSELRARRLLMTPSPAYPNGETRAARVVLSFGVLPDGSVIDVQVDERAGPAFDVAATRALREWRFEPLEPEQQQRVQWGRVVMRFQVR